MVYKVIAILIALFYLCIIARYLIRLGVFINNYKKVKIIPDTTLKKKVLFVIPMYKEKKMAKETFEFFAKIAKTNSNIFLAFVCTLKEDQDNSSETTYDILEKCKENENKHKRSRHTNIISRT